jgi:hypothetical protein
MILNPRCGGLHVLFYRENAIVGQAIVGQNEGRRSTLPAPESQKVSHTHVTEPTQFRGGERNPLRLPTIWKAKRCADRNVGAAGRMMSNRI